ncbi:MutT/nudix [Alkalihalobacillus alcalophilus ATCC 27647 = CGMCC 1.3604]|uniref:MutT/nudix n=1 Tax=Alkalihalobacillus alcalophilus ATCC 27647 = CGMCC 1.3604 TaxID=1218173 RepID=A0A094WNI8_ALKAL|nr:DUF4083 family protein [Alkalihalobacillus alcalophilus]KGA98406.1 hypothetical protein BALCAV_0204835 [Alkalihalobacillus alcalophilus ATCC 27647 = CGMCC 1.3604]MED1563942.1 DUF4083 family protein [Alkalihalobacillus alcalophilus]THG91572.1 MutT/nudix [Alkalihalobacillus alcalophilus ATCC 27647 = CGMCC 1.3604]
MQYDIPWGSILYQIISVGLIILFVYLIIKLVMNSKEKKNQQKELEQKLDKVIGILEKEKK